MPEKGQVLCEAQRDERGVPQGKWTHLTPLPSFLSPLLPGFYDEGPPTRI